MTEILGFPEQDGVKLLHEATDRVLRELGVHAEFREKAVAWAKQEYARHDIPAFVVSIDWTQGITDEQVDHLRRQIHSEFTRYRSTLSSAKREYIIEHVKKNLIDFFEEKAVSWSEQESARHHIPTFDLSITFPDGITDEQADRIRRDINREFMRYCSTLCAS